MLERTAHHVAAAGTQTEARALQAMARAVEDEHPGAAAALVDWAGPEIVRLRAFGVVHGAVLWDLAPQDQSRLRAELLGSNALTLAV